MTRDTPLRNYERRTLVVHTGGLGDFLLACPALQALARQGAVELLGRPERLALAVAGGIAVAAHDIEGVGFDSLFATPTAKIVDFLMRFDRCIVWMRDDGTLACAIRSCGMRDVRTFPGLPPEDWPGHASMYYAHALGFDELPPFHLSVDPTQSYDVIIHPGSGGRRKNWPWENFIALADGLTREGRHITWCLGPAEEEWAWNAAHPVIRPAHPLDLARHLTGAALYIGNDSGATHLAAAVGGPTVAIFGPTDPNTWAPHGPHVRVVAGSPWPEPRDVLAAIGSPRASKG